MIRRIVAGAALLSVLLTLLGGSLCLCTHAARAHGLPGSVLVSGYSDADAAGDCCDEESAHAGRAAPADEGCCGEVSSQQEETPCGCSKFLPLHAGSGAPVALSGLDTAGTPADALASTSLVGVRIDVVPALPRRLPPRDERPGVPRYRRYCVIRC